MNSTQNYHPFSFDLQYAPTLAKGWTAMGTIMKQLQYVSQPEHAQLQPVPEHLWHGGLQHPSKHHWSYLHRWAHEIADFYCQVDAQEREAIDNRTRVQHDFSKPGFPKGLVCFLWEKHDDTQSIIQQLFTRTKVAVSWGAWKPSHKRFNPVERIWDIFECPIPLMILQFSQLLSNLLPHNKLPPSEPTSHSLSHNNLPQLDYTYEHHPDDDLMDTSLQQLDAMSVPGALSAPSKPLAIPDDDDDEEEEEEEEEHHAMALTMQPSWQPSRSKWQWAEASKGVPIDIDEGEQVKAFCIFSNHQTLLDNLYK